MSQFSNYLKTTILLALLTGLLLWAGNFLGGTSGFVIALAIVLIMNFAMYWWSDKIVLMMYRAKELPKDHFAYKMVKELSHKAGLPMPKAYIVESPTPNAFATGRSPKHSAVAVTSGILGLLDESELKAVIAHELSHVKNRDTLIQTIAAVIAGVIAFIASMARWAAIFGGGRDDEGTSNLVGLLVLGILAPLIAVILQMALSRTREYMADAGSAKVMHNGKPLSNALRKLEKGNSIRPFRKSEGNPTTAPLFIINPFRGSFIFEMFSTHPPVEKRIARLEQGRF
ncbi:zinc metalloprotease HtpX [Candidatus Woesearchaeota archaeon]|nr:zinc metalloprotease HtpX [Candidatus Woesearchaeota archaeon]